MKPNITSKEELITPSIANELLKINKKNKPLDHRKINFYAEQMKQGLWKEGTLEALLIDWNNNLLNGQHRLHAIIKSGCSIKFTIGRGLDPNVFSVLDTGKSRTASDTFAIAGIKGYAGASAMVRMYLNLKKSDQIGVSYGSAKGNYQLSNISLLNEYEKSPVLYQETNSMAERWCKEISRMIKATQIGALYLFFYEYSPDLAFNFFEELCVASKTKSNILFTLRKVLTDNAVSHKKYSNEHIIALIIKAFNIYSIRGNTKTLRYNPVLEQFPRLNKTIR